MDQEKNLDSILVLEKQIEEREGHEKAIIQLKRARNSLLNISILLSPEILGSIFCCNVIPDGDFGGLPMGSYNFLLVCHHWFEVASCTPELWSFWGNSIGDWTHRHIRCRTVPLDLVLDSDGRHELGDQLRAALQDRATCDTIRQVHLRDHLGGQPVLNSIISSIVVEGEGMRSSSVESFIVETDCWSAADVSAFFSRYHLPKLHCLRLSGCSISSWDLLKSRITTLTTLKLSSGLSLIQDPSQLLSILSSNPLLQNLSMSPGLAPHPVGGDRSFPPVPLRHLKDLDIQSDSFDATFWLLSRLELPDKLHSLEMALTKCYPLEISQTLGPYLGDRVRGRGGIPGNGLVLMFEYGRGGFNLHMRSEHPIDGFAEMYWFVWVSMNVRLTDEETVGVCFDFIAHIPGEQVIRLKTNLSIPRSEELCIGMRNLTHLDLTEVDLSRCFADPDIHGPHVFGELLRSLEHLKITMPTLNHGDWEPITNILERRAAVGNRISSFVLSCHHQIPPEVVESIERTVEVFER